MVSRLLRYRANYWSESAPAREPWFRRWNPITNSINGLRAHAGDGTKSAIRFEGFPAGQALNGLTNRKEPSAVCFLPVAPTAARRETRHHSKPSRARRSWSIRVGRSTPCAQPCVNRRGPCARRSPAPAGGRSAATNAPRLGRRRCAATEHDAVPDDALHGIARLVVRNVLYPDVRVDRLFRQPTLGGDRPRVVRGQRDERRAVESVDELAQMRRAERQVQPGRRDPRR